MNRVKFPLLLAVLCVAIIATPVVAQDSSPTSSPSSAQSGTAAQDPSSQPPTQTSPSSSASSMSESMDSQTFTGKVAKAGGKYVLRDDTTRTSYTLDDQDRAKQFEGKNVKVTGKLDASSNTIRVTTIEPGS